MSNNSNLFRKCETMLFSISDIFGINNDDMSISEPVYFRIPKYQRSYVWEQGTYDFSQGKPTELKKNKRFKGQLEYFWEDLNNTINNEKHYTGLIGLKKMSEEEKHREYIPKEKLAFYVIDGQQRFTTIMLLISAINEDKNLDKIILDEDYRLLFDYTKEKKGDYREILESVLLNKNCDKSHNYKEKLTNAKSFFVNMLKKTNGNIDVLKNALLNNILFNVFFSIDSDEESNNKMNIAPEIIFESINNRGKELSKIDILKNRIFYLDKQKMIDKEIVDDIESDWTTIFDNLSSISSTQLKDDDYLLTHYYIFGNDSKIKVKTTTLLQNILDIFQINEKIDKREISKYFKTLRDCSKYWLWLNTEINIKQLQEKLTTHDEEKLKTIISKLSHLVDSNYIKSLIILLIYSYNDLKYITISKLISTLNFLEKYIFIYQFLNYRNLDLPYIATKTKNLLFNEKGEYRPKDDFNNQLQKMSNELKDDIKDILDTEHLKSWAKRMMGKNTCFYSWNGIYYTLFELNNSTSEDGKIEWKDIIEYKSKTIEHIYPENANGKNNDNLSKQYWEYACPSSLLEQKSKMIHALGNLIPISPKNNSIVSNKLYPYKLKIYEENGSYMTMTLRKNFKTEIYWDITSIKARTESLFKDIQDRWLKNSEEEYNFNYTIDETILTILTNFNEKQDDSNYLERRKNMEKIWNGYNSKKLCDEIYNKVKQGLQEKNNYSDLYNKDYCSQKFNLDYPILSNKKDEKYFNIFRNKIFLLNLENYDNSVKEKISNSLT